MSIAQKPSRPENQGKFDRIRQFQRYRTSHYMLSKAIDEATLAIEYEDEPTLLLLYGPSGAGKTTLVEHLMKNIMLDHQTEMAENPGHIPAAYVRTMAPSTREFDWKYFYFMANLSVQNPFYSNRMLRQAGTNAKNVLQPYDRETSQTAYIHSLLRNMKNRDLHVLFIDEAQHLAGGATWQSIEKQMQHVKTFTDEAGSLICLCGTYDLLPFRNVTDQLGRRVIEVHLERYRYDNLKHREIFEEIVSEFQNAMPFDKKPDLMSHLELLYMHSVGCIGVLKKWLNRAVIFAVAKNSATVTEAHLMRSLKSVDACATMAKRIYEGETRLAELERAAYSQLRFYLGMDPAAATSAGQPEPNIKAPPKKKVPVGRRNPVRDKVGIKEDCE